MGALKIFLTILGLAIIIVPIVRAFIASQSTRVPSEIDFGKFVLPAAIGIALIIFSMSFGQVPSGAKGVVLRFGATTGEVKDPGLYTVFPFVSTVQMINTQTEAFPVNADAASYDLQQVSTQITLNFHPDPGQVVQIWNTLRNDYTDRVVKPAVQEALKASTANYTAQQLIQSRFKVQQDFRKKLGTSSSKKGQ